MIGTSRHDRSDPRVLLDGCQRLKDHQPWFDLTAPKLALSPPHMSRVVANCGLAFWSTVVLAQRENVHLASGCSINHPESRRGENDIRLLLSPSHSCFF